MVRCITCNHPLPEGQEYPEYFAQSGHDLPEDDPSRWWDHLNKLLIFSRAVFDALHQLDARSEERLEDETGFNLAYLGWELTKEIERRTHGLYRAGQIWQDRAKAASAATDPQTPRKEG